MAGDDTSRALDAAARLAQEYLAALPERPVFPPATIEELRAALGGPLPTCPRDPVERCCDQARALAGGIAALPGAELLNDVVLNQVLVRFADDAMTGRVLAAVQASGEAWLGGTTWQGRPAIRVSVSNWQTTADDVRRTVAAFVASLG